MKYIVIYILFFSSFSCSLRNRQLTSRKLYEHKYRTEFIAQTFYRFLDDKKWKDRINCDRSFNDFSQKDIEMIHLLVDSIGKTLDMHISESTNGQGSMRTHEVPGYCVSKECMKICNSKEFIKLSKQYADNKNKTRKK